MTHGTGRRPGAERSDVAPIWPSTLRRAETKLIYLDLNHWIALAQANTGHEQGERWRDAIARLRTSRPDFTYVIGMPLVMEIIGIRRRKQRADLAQVIEEFTDFACVIPLTTIAGLEFESSLGRLVELQEGYAPVDLLGRGVMRAFGMDGRLTVRDKSGSDVTDWAREGSPVGPAEFDRRLREGELMFDRAILRGPTSDEDERDLVARGWNPAATREVAERRAQQERNQAARLAAEPRWRRGRLRDVVAAGYLALEIEESRDQVLRRHGIALDQILKTVDDARRFTDSMPAADVWITLRTAKHRSENTVWTPNDIFDIDALSIAAAYCDIVVTERAAAHILTQAGVPERLGAEVFTDLNQLAAHLEAT